MRTAWAAVPALIASLAGRPASAQPTLNPLAPPHGGGLMCRAIPGTGATIVLQFMDHPDPAAKAREIKAGYDSAGTPLFIQVWASEHRPGERNRAQILLAGFLPGAKALRAVGDEDSLVMGTDSTRYPKMEAMADSEVASARALAAWLWDRRCIPHRREGS